MSFLTSTSIWSARRAAWPLPLRQRHPPFPNRSSRAKNRTSKHGKFIRPGFGYLPQRWRDRMLLLVSSYFIFWPSGNCILLVLSGSFLSFLKLWNVPKKDDIWREQLRPVFQKERVPCCCIWLFLSVVACLTCLPVRSEASSSRYPSVFSIFYFPSFLWWLCVSGYAVWFFVTTNETLLLNLSFACIFAHLISGSLVLFWRAFALLLLLLRNQQSKLNGWSIIPVFCKTLERPLGRVAWIAPLRYRGRITAPPSIPVVRAANVVGAAPTGKAVCTGKTMQKRLVDKSINKFLLMTSHNRLEKNSKCSRWRRRMGEVLEKGRSRKFAIAL